MTTIQTSSLETDLRMASALAGSAKLLLADRASIRSVGAVLWLGDVNGANTDTLLESFAGLDGYDAMTAATAETEDVSTTALTDASASIAVARYAIRRDITDLAALTASNPGMITPARLAESVVGEFERAWMQLLADVGDGFSGNSVGTSGVDMSADDHYDAIFELELDDVPGPFFGVLHPRQWADLQESLRAEGGAAAFQDATFEALQIKGPGFVGSLNGVDLYKSARVNASGGNRLGFYWGLGAMGYRTGTPIPGEGSSLRVVGPGLAVEIDRNGSAGLTEVLGHGYMGMAVLEDNRGCLISTDQ